MDFLENTTKLSTIYWINYLFFAIEALLQLQCATKIIYAIKQLSSQIFLLALLLFCRSIIEWKILIYFNFQVFIQIATVSVRNNTINFRISIKSIIRMKASSNTMHLLNSFWNTHQIKFRKNQNVESVKSSKTRWCMWKQLRTNKWGV